METKHSVMLLTWTATGKKETHTTLSGLIYLYPQYSFNLATINSYISRAKVPYKDEHCTIEKVPNYHGKHKKNRPTPTPTI